MTDPHFLLVHSPLVTSRTWVALAASLKSAGYGVTQVELHNHVAAGAAHYSLHMSLIDSALDGLQEQRVVAVAHSGAGNLLALLNPVQISAYVFLDAVFPVVRTSRFGLFDDSSVVQQWRALAEQHGGMLPKQHLVKFGEQIKSDSLRAAFVTDLTEVPIRLYEEVIPVHAAWPAGAGGLYVQWTHGYREDAARAEAAGFTLRSIPGSHFEMLDAPDEVAGLVIEYVFSRPSPP